MLNSVQNYGMTNYQMSFHAKSKIINSISEQAKTLAPEAKDFASKLTEYKSADGKPILSLIEAQSLVKSCRLMPNYQEKITAVLKNPQEVAVITQHYNKNRGLGVWSAILEPLCP